MSGRWLIAVASRLLRDETFRLTVAPAIADLQHERTTRTLLRRARDHGVIWLTIVRALFGDLRHTAVALIAEDAARAVWPRLLAAYALIFVVGALSRLNHGIRIHTPDMAPGEFNRLPLPAFGDGLEPYLAGLLVSMALTAAAYTMVPAVFMLRRRRVHVSALVVAVLTLAFMTYGVARVTRPTQQQSSDYATAAILRGTGLYPAHETLAAIVRDDVRPRRDAEMRRRAAARTEERRDIAAAVRAHARWAEVSRGLGVLAYALVGAAIARGRNFGVLARFAGIMAATAALSPVLPYLSLLIWPVFPATLGPAERDLRESQLAFVLLPLVTMAFLWLPRFTRSAAATPLPQGGDNCG